MRYSVRTRQVAETLYHLTTSDAFCEIAKTGAIDPQFSRGKMRVCWYTAYESVFKTLKHLETRCYRDILHGAVLEVCEPMEYFRVYRKNSLFYSYLTIQVRNAYTSQFFFEKIGAIASVPTANSLKIEFGLPWAEEQKKLSVL